MKKNIKRGLAAALAAMLMVPAQPALASKQSPPDASEEEQLIPEEIEEEKEAAAEAKRRAPATPDAEKAAEAYMTSKELNRRRLAEARKRDAEKYGDEYVEVTDQDLM